MYILISLKAWLKGIISLIVLAQATTIAPVVQLEAEIQETAVTAVSVVDIEFPEYGGAEEATTTPEVVEEVKPMTRPQNYYNCSCVSYARAHSPFGDFPRVVSAKDIPVLLYQPIVGAIAIFSAGGSYHSIHGHASVVMSVDGDTMRVKEWNLKRCGYSERSIAWRGANKDPYLLGFWGRE